MKFHPSNLFFSTSLRGKMICVLLCISSLAFAQKKKTPEVKNVVPIISYEVLDSGDTINRLDAKQRRQGRWLFSYEARYGEAGYHEVGQFQDNIKVGRWQQYSLDGRLLTDEFYKKGNKDGEAKYYEDGQLYCIGHFLALNSNKVYDTIQVEDPITNEFKNVAIKTDAGSVRHGFWTYYEPSTAVIKRVVEYQADEIVYERDYLTKKDSTYIDVKQKSYPHITNQEPNQVWFTTDKRKAPRYTDFSENQTSVIPNKRAKKK